MQAPPAQRDPIASSDGRVTNPWQWWFAEVARQVDASGGSSEDLADDIAAICRALGSPDGTPGNIPDDAGAGELFGQGSIRVLGQLSDGRAWVTLAGDTDEPGFTYCYGTDALGDKGWFPISDALAATSDITLTVGADGISTIGLADITPTAGGTLQKTAFDAKGRRSQEAAATTDDLAEGSSNLYHTAARVRAVLLTGLSTATNAAITAADSVLSALGKLQAQISGLVVQTITDGDTTHVPSGDAVFNALSGKYDKTGGDITGIAAIAPPSGSAQFDVRAPTAGVYSALGFSTGTTRRWLFQKNADPESGVNSGSNFAISAYRDDGTYLGDALNIVRSTMDVRPGSDNTQNLGVSFRRWKEIFAANATINTSDAREKTEPRDLTAAELSCASDLARLPSIFQWLHVIEEKGEDARLHCSPTVQSVIAIMESHGLDPFRYGFVCYDEWDETPEVVESWEEERDDEGNVTREAGSEVTQEYRPAGNRYSLRPSELAHFVMRGLAHRQDQLEARLAALESE